jgi:hypothetical protein
MNQRTAQNIHTASQAYFRLVAEQVPTEAELTAWLARMAAANVSRTECEHLRSLGPVANWSAEPHYISFRGYVAENRCLEMVNYLAEHLSMADFAAWVDFHTGKDGEPKEVLRVLSKRPEPPK